ncbi:MAG: hypothetical protein HRU00_17470 [Myxococcales bacterium]|nr:hypothetical protein [Myxococcales bacterium]
MHHELLRGDDSGGAVSDRDELLKRYEALQHRQVELGMAAAVATNNIGVMGDLSDTELRTWIADAESKVTTREASRLKRGKLALRDLEQRLASARRTIDSCLFRAEYRAETTEEFDMHMRKAVREAKKLVRLLEGV